jgi:hypothetical protein
VDDTVIRLNIVSDASGAAVAQRALAAVKKEQDELNAAFDRGAVGGERFKARMAELATEAGRYHRSVEQLNRSTASVDTAMHGVATGTTAWSRSLLQFGYVAQDAMSFQNGMRQGLVAIQNNIPGIVLAMGGGPGLAGTIALVGTAAQLAYEHLDKLHSVLGTSPVRSYTAQMKDLSKSLTEDSSPEDRARVAKFKREQAAGEAGEGVPKSIAKMTSEAADALHEYGGTEAVSRAVAKARFKDHYTNQEEDERIKALEANKEALKKQVGDNRAFPEIDKEIKDIKDKAEREANQGAKEDVQKALTDPEQLRAMIGFVRKNPQYFAHDENGVPLDAALEGMTPEGRRRVEQARLDYQGRKNVTAHERRQNEERKALTEQGSDNARDLFEKMAEDATRDTGKVLNDALRDSLVTMRAAGLSARKETAYLESQIKAEALRLHPELARFPEVLRQVVAGVRVQVREAFDQSVAALMAGEGLARADALRRLDAQRRQRVEQQQGQLANDTLRAAMSDAYDALRRRNPNLPKLSEKQKSDVAKAVQDQFEGLAIAASDQVEIARAMSNPAVRRRWSRVFQLLAGVGFSERDALMLLPNIDARMQGQGITATRAAMQAAVAFRRNQMQAFFGARRMRRGADVPRGKRIAGRERAKEAARLAAQLRPIAGAGRGILAGAGASARALLGLAPEAAGAGAAAGGVAAAPTFPNIAGPIVEAVGRVERGIQTLIREGVGTFGD